MQLHTIIYNLIVTPLSQLPPAFSLRHCSLTGLPDDVLEKITEK